MGSDVSCCFKTVYCNSAYIQRQSCASEKKELKLSTGSPQWGIGVLTLGQNEELTLRDKVDTRSHTERWENAN